MAKSALPLILGVAAAALILGKKGKGSSGSSDGTVNPDAIIFLQAGDTEEALDARFAELGFSKICLIASTVVTSDKTLLRNAVEGLAADNPRMAFFVADGLEGVEVLASWFGGTVAELNEGVLVVAVDTNIKSSSAPAQQTQKDVVANELVEKLTAMFSAAKAGHSASGVSGGRGLAGSASTASTTGGRPRGLAGSAPAASQQTSLWGTVLNSVLS